MSTIPSTLNVADTIKAGLPAPDHPPIESTGSSLLNLENAGALQMGFWVPNRVYASANYLIPLRNQVRQLRSGSDGVQLHPAVAEFKDWITSNSAIRMGVNMMIEQSNMFVCYVEMVRPDLKDVIIMEDGDNLAIEHFDAFFETISMIIQTSPSFNATAQVGTPLNGFLAVPMGTVAGTALFHDASFNAQFKKVLDAWNAFLKSPASLDKLDINDPEKPGSWISKQAQDAGVWTDMVYDASKPAYGFASWNDFFIRQFQPGVRPFTGDAAVSVNIGCETTPWAYANDVAFESNFWVKDVDYSLLDLFGGRADVAQMFVGGQIYQGFLSATHYHRWTAPLDGQLVSSWVEPGTYFAQRPGQGEVIGTWDGTESQPFLGHVAARAIFVFNHERCGLVAMICIGMVEVSTCVIEPAYLVPAGQQPVQITRGTEIGHFEFGGSTHMLVFQKDKVQLESWALKASDHSDLNQKPTPMGTVIATAIA
ncbi:hypothetical protein OC834_000914 [Tilletia horrida]|nr:hypothetical protein OC834_000914 [Tilletia horrida]KAK0539745.1 hypothetical protein OC835_001007 [Tilletia horrida]